jgi:ABC-type enterochelin transport system permease subunit
VKNWKHFALDKTQNEFNFGLFSSMFSYCMRIVSASKFQITSIKIFLNKWNVDSSLKKILVVEMLSYSSLCKKVTTICLEHIAAVGNHDSQITKCFRRILFIALLLMFCGPAVWPVEFAGLLTNIPRTQIH